MAGKGGTAPTKNGPNTSLPPSKHGKNPQLPPYQTKMFLVPPFCNLFAIFQVPLCWKGGAGHCEGKPLVASWNIFPRNEQYLVIPEAY